MPDVTEQLDKVILDILQRDNLPSAVVRASVPGKGSYVFVAGLADIPTQAKRTENHPFRIASITKMFVATAVLQLVDVQTTAPDPFQTFALAS
jgi:CubicO group peptidase (beta-lactamase class C family)